MWFCAWCRQARWQQLPLEGPCCFSRLPITRATLRFTFSFAKLSEILSLSIFSLWHLNDDIQVDWSKMTEDSASVADKIKKKLHIQSKSGLEKFQVIVTIH